jgi:hypothetical protein
VHYDEGMATAAVFTVDVDYVADRDFSQVYSSRVQVMADTDWDAMLIAAQMVAARRDDRDLMPTDTRLVL